MPLDSVCISALVRELGGQAVGMRVDKLQQPERDTLVLSLRGQKSSARLLIAAGTGDARLHFTSHSLENPQQPPMFCMLLRKHLTGARITGISQHGLERMADIAFDTTDQLGDACEKHLIVELMGRYSNIILTGGDGLIIDCLRRVDAEMSEKRQVLPGLIYRLPPPQQKLDPFSDERPDAGALIAAAAADMPADRWLLSTFTGLSPLLCREIAYRACGETDMPISELAQRGCATRVDAELRALADMYNDGTFMPCMLVDGDGKPADFSCIPILQYGAALRFEEFSTFSELLDAFYARRSMLQHMRQRSAALLKTVKNARDRVSRKLAAQMTELQGTKGRERLREYGDIITANLYRMKKSESVLIAEDFYSGGTCEIPLDIRKTPQQNAAKYYKDYTKARNAEMYLTEQISLGETELSYLNSVVDEIERAESESDLSDIRRELTDAGYLKVDRGARAKPRPSRPMLFVSDSGYEIRVGRSNVQNDLLTFKSSRRTDIWLHAQKIHGSHVVISANGGEPDEATVVQAAKLAAWYSQARGSGKVPVDVTEIRRVKKPAGAKPGMVIYTDYRTVLAEPDGDLADRIRKE